MDLNRPDSLNPLALRVESSLTIAKTSDADIALVRSSRLHLAALLACVIILFACYTRFAMTFPRNSDDAALVLEAQDIVHGNVLLHGWNLPPDSHYTTITPWYVLGLLAGINPADLMYAVPSLIYAILVGFLLAIAWTRNDPAHRIESALATFAIVGLPAYARMGPPTGSGYEHDAAVLFVLATFYLLAIGVRAEVSAIPLALGMMGDPLAIFIGIAPLVVVGACRFWLDRGDRRCLVSAATAVLAAVAGWTMISRFGGFNLWGLSTQFATPAGFLHNLVSFGQYSFELFGVEPSSGVTALLAAAPRTAMLLFAILGVCGAVIGIVKRGGDVLTQLSAAAVVLDIAAYVTSTHAVDWTTIRFLTPAVIFAALLAGQWWYRIGISRQYIFGAIIMAVIVNGIAFVQGMSHAAVEFPNEVISYLTSAHLREGYGAVWDANLLSVASDGDLAIAPVGMGNDGRLVFYPWLSSDESARMRDARFLVFSGNWGGVSESAATNTWGQPAETKTIGSYRILIWNAPLAVINPAAQR